MEPLHALLKALGEHSIRFATIGVWGANCWAPGPGAVFVTEDCDLFLPPDADNLLAAWRVCEGMGVELTSSGGPLDRPRDLGLAERIVERRALTHATDGEDLEVDLTLVMAGFEFERVWAERRVFQVGGIDIPVARLRHIVESKVLAGRDKDRLFLATHREALRELLGEEPPPS